MIFAVSVIFASSGCGTSRSAWDGPRRAVAVEVDPWIGRDAPAAVLKSPRYWVYTTLPKGRRRDALPQVLEGAYAQYQWLAAAPAAAAPDDWPMHCYVFGDRQEWLEFTARRTGHDARMYQEIPRGGYTIGDWFVAYADNDAALFSAAAHEGWHQYAARHFRDRLPPFLDEGLACLFEAVRMERGLPRWNLTINPGRASALKSAAEHGQLRPLEELITMHAGDVVDQPQPTIDVFYAQSWALARFLLEAHDGRYRPALKRLLADAAAGTIHDHRGTRGTPPGAWDSSGARAVLEHYLAQDLPSIDRSYRAFITEITGVPGRRAP